MCAQYLTLRERKQTRNKAIAIWLTGLAVLALSVWGVVKLSDSSKQQLVRDGTIPSLSDMEPVLGAANPKVTLYEYADFQCPACREMESVIKQILSDYPDVALVYRYFPLIDIHPNAFISAAAAEAARIQGRFWEIHDLLYANQGQWANFQDAESLFTAYAQSLGLDTDKFRSDMASSEVQNKILADYNSALSLRLDHTPTFAVNGKIIDNPATYEEFKTIIERELSK